MLRDKIKTILATETSDMMKIRKLSDALEKLFLTELAEATILALNKFYEEDED